MKTIKIIDLLNKIANGEEAPKKIKCKGYEYWYCKDLKDYQNAEVEYRDYLFASKYHTSGWLNYEVEILDEFEDIEEINIGQYYGLEDSSLKYDTVSTINQLINNQKKIIERLNNETRKKNDE